MGFNFVSPFAMGSSNNSQNSQNDPWNGIGQTFGLNNNTASPYSVDPNAFNINWSGSNGVGGQQQSLYSQLMAQANGQGPSLAQMQLQQATDANMRQAMALGQTQTGIGAGAGLRSVMDAQAGAQQQSAGQSAIVALQQQMAARQQAASLLNQMRTADIQQTGLTSQAAQAGQQLNQQNAFQYAGLNNQINQASANRWDAIIGSLLNSGGGAMSGGGGGGGSGGGGGGGGGGGFMSMLMSLL